ncbi:MAG: glycine oxidase ThiO [Gammaproteobacteria bacterium]|nr:glycine oxidase ThiO [Gammaproteobacteria bacterium]
MPHRDVVVVGGGVLGMLTARMLAMAGCSVHLLEQGVRGRQASWAGGGILSPLYPWRYPAAVSALARRSQSLHPPLAAALQAETGHDSEWLGSGLLVLDDTELAAARGWADQWQTRLQPLDQRAINQIQPGLKPAEHALWLPEIAQLRNPRFLAALSASIDQLGINTVEQAEVTGFEHSGQRLTGVVTRSGDRFHADQFVLATGAWSGQLSAEVGGTPLPVRPVRGQMLLFQARPGLLQRIVLHGERYLIPRKDGRILCGSTLEEVGFDLATTQTARRALEASALEILPALADYPVIRHWAGLRPGSPDGTPFIGRHPARENLYVNAGQYRNGLVLAPGSCELLVDLMLHRSPKLDPTPYAPPA